MKKQLLFCLSVVCFMTLFCAAASAQVLLNEAMLSTAIYENGTAYEWVELYNDSDDAAPLQGMTLCYLHKGDMQTWEFPDGVSLPAHGYLPVYLTGYESVPSTAGALYAAIDASKDGGTLALINAQKSIEHALTLPAQFGDISYGRVGDTDVYQYLGTATRGGANCKDGYPARTQAVVFSEIGGFYQEAPDLTAYSESGAVIRYTVDGSTPAEDSPEWVGILALNPGVTNVRARAFSEGKLPSETRTQTYFVGVSRDVAVVSLVTDEKYLFDNQTGSLVKGTGSRANYLKDWEYPINVEFFDQDNRQQLNQMATFRVTGETSRNYGQKPISLFARPALGSKTFKFNPFDNREGVKEYKSLTLRAGGSESYKTRFKDAMMVRLAKDTGIYYQESLPCVVYINGKYWGQYNLRERINKHSLAAFEGITDKKIIDGVTIIKGRGQVQQGSIDEWNELIRYVRKNSMKDEAALQYVLDRLDVDSYFTMVAFEILSGNGDIGNQRMYKFPGGKWKTVLYDLDAAMQNTKRTPFNYFLKATTAENSLFYHEPFAALIKNPAMKDKFLTICGKLLAEKFVPGDLIRQIDEWVSVLSPLMDEQIARWPGCSPNSTGTWMYEVNAFKKIARTRPKQVVNYLVAQFRLDKEQKAQYFGEFLAKIQ